MQDAALGRIIDFRNSFNRRQAARVVELDGGYAVLDDQYAASYDHNKLILAKVSDPGHVVTSADEVLGGAGLAHRLVVITDDQAGLAAAPWFVEAGYQHDISVFMRHTGTPADRPADPAIAVRAVPWQELREVDHRTWREQLPEASEQAIEQLVTRRSTRLRGADKVAFLVIRDPDGQIVSHAELYLDATGVAQIEQVMTEAGHGGRGYARALMADGLLRATAAGCDLVFVEADAIDWPQHLYARLGYAVVGRGHTFTRPAPSH